MIEGLIHGHGHDRSDGDIRLLCVAMYHVAKTAYRTMDVVTLWR